MLVAVVIFAKCLGNTDRTEGIFLLFTTISPVEHQGINESLHNGALSLSKFQDLISTGGVWDKYLGFSRLKGYMILENDDRLMSSSFFVSFFRPEVFEVIFTAIIFPFTEKFWFGSEKWLIHYEFL